MNANTADAEQFTDDSRRRWVPRWMKISLAAVAVAVPLLIACSFEVVDERVALALQTWSVWSVIAFLAMQGPGQWRSILGGILFACLLTALAVPLYSRLRPYAFGSWETFWAIDFPAAAMDLVLGWCTLRLLSMITGIEIVDTKIPRLPRWSLARWFYFVAVLAVMLQASIFKMNWLAEMSAGFVADSTVGPFPESPLVLSRRTWLGIQLAELLFIPFVPLLGAAWMMAGRPWRWLFFPLLAVLAIGAYAAAETLFDQAVYQEAWLKRLYPPIKKEWALLGTLSWFAYCFTAILVPWMGFRWTDYWSGRTRISQPIQLPATE